MRLIRILDRYLIREVAGPIALGLGVFTFILLIDALFDVADLVLRRGVGLGLVLQFLALSLPHILVLTIPMAFLFGLLIAVGRLSADSELIAIRASGVSLFTLYLPVAAVSLALAGMTAFLMVNVLPRSNQAQLSLIHEMSATGLAYEVKPRVFFEELEDYILYVWDTPPQEQWRGVFLADAVATGSNLMIVAESGRLQFDDSGHPGLVLTNTVMHEIEQLDRGDDLRIRTDQTYRVRLEDDWNARSQQKVSRKSRRAMTIGELQTLAADPSANPADRRLAEVEIHKKFSIPAACLVFGVFGLALGLSNRRGGKSSGFVLSTAVILAYYVMLSNGEEAALRNRLAPALATWLPNVLFAAAGVFLLARRNRDQSVVLIRLSHLFHRVAGRAAAAFGRAARRQQPAPSTESEQPRPPARFLLRTPRFSLLFPNLLDRYVMRLFVRVFALVVLATTAVYVIADFTELVDEIMSNRVSSSVVLSYYATYSLQIFYQLAPIVVLLTTLTTFAVLSYNNEITAAKALGMSLYRLALPAVVSSLLVAGLSVALEWYVLPTTNARVAELKDRIKGRETVRTYRRADRQWLAGEGGFLYNYQYFDERRNALQRLQVFRFDQQHRLVGRLYADYAVHRNGEWLMTGGWARRFSTAAAGDAAAATDVAATARVVEYRDQPGPIRIDLPELPAFFDTEIKSPEQMNRRELRRYIAALTKSGQEVPELRVQLHNKIAMPFVCLVMALVALPFAFRLGRRGALYGIGLSLGLGITFYALIAFFTTLGETAALPAPVAVWGPNFLFATMSLYLFLGVRT